MPSARTGSVHSARLAIDALAELAMRGRLSGSSRSRPASSELLVVCAAGRGGADRQPGDGVLRANRHHRRRNFQKYVLGEVTDSLFAALTSERQPYNTKEALMDNDSRPNAAGAAPPTGPAGEGWGTWDGNSVYACITGGGSDQRPAGMRPHGEGKTSAEAVEWAERVGAAVMAARERLARLNPIT
jgi:hypothetical protein